MRELLFMFLRDSNRGLATGVATVMLVVGEDGATVWTGAALTGLDEITVRSIVGAGAGVETAVEAGGRPAGGRPAAGVVRETSDVVLLTGAVVAEGSETTWESMSTEEAAGVDE